MQSHNQPFILRETLVKRVAVTVMLGGVGCLLAVIAIALAWHSGSEAKLSAQIALMAIAVLLFAPASVLFLWCSAYVWLWRIEIYEDRIVKHYGLWSRTILVSDLRGGRRASERLILESNKGVKIGIPESLLDRLDPPPIWLEELIDLGAQDYRDAVEKLGAHEGFGATFEARFEYLARLHKIGFRLLLLAFALFLWALLWPHPLPVALSATASLTVVAIALVLTGRFRPDPREGNSDVRPSLFYCFFLPALVLAGRAFHDWNLLDLQTLFRWSAGLGLAVTALLAFRSASLRRNGWPIVLCAILLTAWSAGVLCTVDVLADKAPVVKYPVEVLAVRRSEHFDYITVEPWGPVRHANQVRISGHMEPALKKGARVCVYMGRGRLGLAWYALGDC